MFECCTPEKTQEDINRRYSVKQLLEMQQQLNDFLFENKTDVWSFSLSTDQLLTACLDEMFEFIGSGISWKWWKEVPVSEFDAHNAKIEITDASFFYLSLMIFAATTDPDISFGCEAPNFDQWDGYYVGTDKGATISGVGLLCNINGLNHENFIGILRELMDTNKDIFEMIYTLDALVTGAGMTSTVYSAYYAAKHALNEYRFTIPDYENDHGGVEDNVLLEPLIQAFLDDPAMTLDELRQSVQDTFFTVP